jgi:hypothetical protein
MAFATSDPEETLTSMQAQGRKRKELSDWFRELANV